MKLKQPVLTLAVLGAGWHAVWAAPPLPAFNLDADVNRALKTFDVPGMAIAIVKDGKVVVAKGYGVRKLGDPAPVDGKTLFEIASNSKAFTAAGLAMLVDEGKLAWDDPVTKHLPGFQMYDSYVTGQMTVRDLLVHRSGLGLGAGDLLWWPSTNSAPTRSSPNCVTSSRPPASAPATRTTTCCTSWPARSSPTRQASRGARRCRSAS
jgi:CubicO group peptidase (beta-lactamase class C family)